MRRCSVTTLEVMTLLRSSIELVSTVLTCSFGSSGLSSPPNAQRVLSTAHNCFHFSVNKGLRKDVPEDNTVLMNLKKGGTDVSNYIKCSSEI